MYFTPAVAATILAFATGVFAVPAGAPPINAKNSTAPTTTASTATGSMPTKATSTSTPQATGLTLTQQLFIADDAAARFALLPKDEAFKFDFIKNTPEGVQKNGGLVTANRKTMPALVTSGGSLALGRVKPCTMNTLHVHPRGAELQYVTKGKLTTQMVPENAVQKDGKPRVINNVLTAGQAQVFYQGSVHTQANFECEEAEFVAFFTNEEAGAGSIAQEFFAADDKIIAGTLGDNGKISAADIPAIREKIPASFLAQLTECVAKCKKSNSTSKPY